MTTDLTGIYNMALQAVGVRHLISLSSENSREAEQCNIWFPSIRDQILAAARWPEATKQALLAQLALQDDDTWVEGEPRPGYAYQYAVPSDCLRPQFLTDYSPFVFQQFSTEVKSILTNYPSPILVYTFRQTTISMWSPELKMAMVYALAANICIPLTGKSSRTKLLLQQANNNILSARESAANSDNQIYESIPDWISARGFVDSSTRSRYFYPLGGLMTGVVSPSDS